MAEMNPILQAAGIQSPQQSPVPVKVPTQDETEEASQVAPGETVSSSTTTKTKTTSVDTIDSPEAVTFEEATRAIDTGISEAKSLTEDLVTFISEQGNVSREAAKATVEAGKNAATVKKTEDVATLEAQARTKDIFNAAGGADELTRLAAARYAAQQDLLEKQNAVQENVDRDFWDDPVQGVIDYFTINALDEEVSVAARKLDMIDTAINNITSLGTKVDQTLDNVKQDVTVATIAAEQELLAQQATIKSAEWNLRASETGANKTRAWMQMSEKQMTATVDKYKLGLLKKSEEIQDQERKLRLKKLEEDSDFEDTYVAGVLRGRDKTLGTVYKGSDPELIKKQRNEILAGFKVGGDIRDRLNREYEVGVGAVKPTPFETYRAVSTINPARFTDRDNPALNALSASVSAVAEAANQPGAAELTEDNAPGLINDRVKADFKAAHDVIKEGEENNPYQAPPLKVLVAQETLAQDPFIINTIKPLLTDEVDDIDTTQVVKLALAAVKTKDNPNGYMSLEQAVNSLTKLYGFATTYNNMKYLEDLALPEQTKYNARLEGVYIPTNEDKSIFLQSAGTLVLDRAFPKDITVDLTDPVEVRNTFVKMLSQYINRLDSKTLFDKSVNSNQEK